MLATKGNNLSVAIGNITNLLSIIFTDPSDLEKAYEMFHADMNNVVIHFGLVGCAFMFFGFIQVSNKNFRSKVNTPLLQFSLFKYIGDNTTYRLRHKFILRLLKKDAKYFDTISTGYLSTVLNELVCKNLLLKTFCCSNLERFREAFNEKIAFIICFSTDFAIGTALAFYTSWTLASYGSVFAFGIVISGLLNSTSMMKSNEKQSMHYSNAGAIAFQALCSFKTVISLNGQTQELEKLD